MSASALNIYEILHEIFLQLILTRQYSPNVIDRQSLVLAALTCRAFSEPALDVLWEEMDSIMPLLKILPAIQEEDGMLGLLGPVAPEEWSRLQQYARRIHRIRCNNYSDEGIFPVVDSSVCIRLAGLTHGKALLPSLRAMTCEPGTVAFLCLSPSLHKVLINNPRGRDTVGPFLHALVDAAPLVASLAVNSYSLIKSSLGAFMRFEHLSSLAINTLHIDQPALNILASLSCLSVLSIDLSDADSHFFENTRREQRYFHDLLRLSIRGSASLSTELLSRLTGTAFQALEISDSWAGDAVDLVLLKSMAVIWHALFEELSRFSQSFLRLAVGYYCQCTHIAGYYDQIQAISVLQPLLHLRNLEALTFFDFLPMCLLDADVDNIARAWPMIQFLMLPSTLGTIRPTAFALESFARFCPRLANLQLSIDLQVLPPMIWGCLPPHSLKVLSLTRSLGCDPTLLARYLDGIFPSVCVQVWDCALAERSGEIDRALELCRAARSGLG